MSENKTTIRRKITGFHKNYPLYEIPEDMKPGSIHYNIKGLALKVVEYHNNKKVDVEFLKSGYRTTVQADKLRAHKVKDFYSPTVINVGYLGKGKYKASEHPLFYDRWHKMIVRCYSGANPCYDDVEVCDRWLNFQNFCEDIQKLEGYEEFILDPRHYVLDKDKYSNGYKIYSPSTCCFITQRENTNIK